MNDKTNNSNKLILLDILLLFVALIERLIVALSFANDSCTCITIMNWMLLMFVIEAILMDAMNY
jgi:hypothetical protein